jgi:hypothetical protein
MTIKKLASRSAARSSQKAPVQTAKKPAAEHEHDWSDPDPRLDAIAIVKLMRGDPKRKVWSRAELADALSLPPLQLVPGLKYAMLAGMLAKAGEGRTAGGREVQYQLVRTRAPKGKAVARRARNLRASRAMLRPKPEKSRKKR